MRRIAISLLATAFCAGCHEGGGDAGQDYSTAALVNETVATAIKPLPAPFPAGLYGSVCLSELTGDLGGFEVRFFEEAGVPMAEFVLCEGWCNETFVSELARDGAAFRFHHIEELQGAQVTRHLVEYQVRQESAGYRLKSWHDGKELPWGEGELLAPLSAPTGIAVAKGEDEWRAPACRG